MKSFGGKILFLDRSDINTDEIIPAKYLTEISREALAPHCLEDLKLAGFDPKNVKGKGAVITRGNFGCGSSREHAPWALEMNGIHAVIAESYARIFRQNMFNGGLLAIELPKDEIEKLFRTFSETDAFVSFNVQEKTLTVTGGGKSETVKYVLAGFDNALVEAGGWVEYADAKY